MRIKSIKRKNFKGKVYNFHCLPNETYCSEGVVVHNCYKNNTNAKPENMTLEDFKKIFNSMCVKTEDGRSITPLTQIAFGITGIQTNSDFIDMMKYSRENGVIPNFTLSGIDLTDEMANEVSKLVGAVAVSAYESDKEICYDTVNKFNLLGLNQTNIHLLASNETLDFVYEVLNDSKTDKRLKGLNAIVFLVVKPKGRAKGMFNHLSIEQYKELITYCFDHDIPFGFDSCSAPKFEATIKSMELKDEKKAQLINMSESCESDLFSSYINVKGEYWNCSFSENENGVKCVDVTKTDDFLKDVWYSNEINEFRSRLLDTVKNGCRHCPTFPEINS